jgi:predicted Zn-ribbon and HTH transcriptional regulator
LIIPYWIKYPEKNKEKNRRYYREHREEILIKDKQRQIDHPESHRQRVEKYKQNHPERIKALKSISDHRRRGFIIHVSSKELEALLIQAKYCPQCGVEFFKPRVKTVDRINNAKIMTMQTIQIICLKCNMKNAKESGIWKNRKRKS